MDDKYTNHLGIYISLWPPGPIKDFCWKTDRPAILLIREIHHFSKFGIPSPPWALGVHITSQDTVCIGLRSSVCSQTNLLWHHVQPIDKGLWHHCVWENVNRERTYHWLKQFYQPLTNTLHCHAWIRLLIVSMVFLHNIHLSKFSTSQRHSKALIKPINSPNPQPCSVFRSQERRIFGL